MKSILVLLTLLPLYNGCARNYEEPSWTEWSNCSKTCGHSVKTRNNGAQVEVQNCPNLPQCTSKMFVSGDDSYRSSLALDFTTNGGCSILPKFWPVDSFRGVGGMLDNVPIFCDSANWKFQDDQKYKDLWDGCMLWKSGKWRRGPNMLTNRFQPAGIIMGNKLWITGGSTCNGYEYRDLAPTGKHEYESRRRKNCDILLKSTELISLESTEPFVDLPKPLIRHCIIKINDDLVMVTGGQTVLDEDPTESKRLFEKNTHFFSFSHQRWIPGPDMSLARREHACGTFLMGDETIMVVAGGAMVVEDKAKRTDSVEFLSLQNLDKGWFNGPKLPCSMRNFPMLTSPNGKGLITIGGAFEACDIWTDLYFDGILEMKCEDGALDNCSWLESPLNMTKIIEEDNKKYNFKGEVDDNHHHRFFTLNQGRADHVAFWIPEELDMCQPKQDEEQDSDANQGQE